MLLDAIHLFLYLICSVCLALVSFQGGQTEVVTSACLIIAAMEGRHK